jgi:hypothetical protein
MLSGFIYFLLSLSCEITEKHTFFFGSKQNAQRSHFPPFRTKTNTNGAPFFGLSCCKIHVKHKSDYNEAYLNISQRALGAIISQTTEYYTEYQSPLAGRLNWLPPHLHRKRVPSRIQVGWGRGGTHTRLWEGGGGSQFRRWDRHYGTLYTNPFFLSQSAATGRPPKANPVLR